MINTTAQAVDYLYRYAAAIVRAQQAPVDSIGAALTRQCELMRLDAAYADMAAVLRWKKRCRQWGLVQQGDSDSGDRGETRVCAR
jgi:hypothetical protein